MPVFLASALAVKGILGGATHGSMDCQPVEARAQESARDGSHADSCGTEKATPVRVACGGACERGERRRESASPRGRKGESLRDGGASKSVDAGARREAGVLERSGVTRRSPRDRILGALPW